MQNQTFSAIPAAVYGLKMKNPSPNRYLQPESPVALASLVQLKYSVRGMAEILARSLSAVSRVLRRNAQPSGYASTPARACAERRRQHSRPPIKLHPDGVLFALMRHFLGRRWSPEQIALTLARVFHKGHEHPASQEAIYKCIYALPVGELKRELIATLRHDHNKRVPRNKGKDRRGQIPDMESIVQIGVKHRFSTSPAVIPIDRQPSPAGWLLHGKNPAGA